MKKIVFIFIILLGSLASKSQDKKIILIPTYTNVIKSDSGFICDAYIVDGDTLPLIKLYKVVIFPKRKFKNRRERRRYYRLEYNLKIVYPYAVLIGEYYNQITKELEHMPDGPQRRKYIRRKEKELKKKYQDALVNLTVTQGRLLIKLVDRETSHTTFEVIKQLKGSMSAYFWQSIARLIGDNLKSEYNPSQEDKYIEEIIAQIENGQI
jgi:hypothetical protein